MVDLARAHLEYSETAKKLAIFRAEGELRNEEFHHWLVAYKKRLAEDQEKNKELLRQLDDCSSSFGEFLNNKKGNQDAYRHQII